VVTTPGDVTMSDADGLMGMVSQSVMATLGGFPDRVAQSPTAMAAMELARSIDQGPETYRFQAALVKELRECMAELWSAAESAGQVEDDVDDLAARRAARRADADAV
jgi:hypothetical protein